MGRFRSELRIFAGVLGLVILLEILGWPLAPWLPAGWDHPVAARLVPAGILFALILLLRFMLRRRRAGGAS